MSDRATLRRLLREHAEAVSTEIAFIKEDAILRLFDATQSEHDAQVAALQAALDAALKRAEAAEARVAKLQSALALILDCVDYTNGACGLTEMIGGALPRQIIDRARDALKGGEE